MSKRDDLKNTETSAIAVAITAALALGKVALDAASKSKKRAENIQRASENMQRNSEIDRQIANLREKKHDYQNEFLGSFVHSDEIDRINKNIDYLNSKRT